MIRMGLLVIMVFLLGIGCSPAATPGVGESRGAPSMEIIFPSPGASVSGPDVTIEIQVTNLTLKPADGVPQPNQGHFHIFVDNSLDYDITHEPTHSLALSPGEHTARVEVRDNAHFHLNPRVIREVTFTVTGEYALPTPEFTPTPYTEYRE